MLRSLAGGLVAVTALVAGCADSGAEAAAERETCEMLVGIDIASRTGTFATAGSSEVSSAITQLDELTRAAERSQNEELRVAVELFRHALMSGSSEDSEATYRRLNDVCTRLGVPLRPK